MKGYPFIQFTLFLIFGILIGNSSFFARNDQKVFVLLTILIVLYISLYIIYIKTNLAFALKLWLGINAKLIVIVAGAGLVMLDNYLNRNDDFLKDRRIHYYEGLIISDKIEKPKYSSYNIEVKKIFYNDTWHKTKGKIILNIKKTSLAFKYKYGHIVLVKGIPNEVTEPKNEWEFNYKKYLKQQNIHYIHYADPEDIFLTGKIYLNPVQNLAYNIRDGGMKIFQTYIPGRQEYEVAAALVLGILGSMEKDLKLQYQKAGVIHVLAISGLHVLILFNLITFCLYKFKNKPYGKYFYYLTVLSVLWLFAFVAGLSPSVLRATVMFTFIVISSALHKKASVFNSLALSAFFLLLINPKLINDLGFQLSYLAVIGIAIFSTPVYNIFKTSYLIPNWLIKMIAATVAAQVATLPVLLYHFHVFPTWFIITNIFMIPGINLILYTSLVLLIISWQTTLANFIGQIIDWCLKVLHIFLYKCNSLPYAQINGFNIALWEALVFYLMLLLFIIFLQTKKFSIFIICVTCLITLSIHQTYVTFKQVSKERIVVYEINNTPVVSFITGKSLVVLNDSTVSETLLMERINNHIQKEGINEIINLKNGKHPFCIKHWKDYSFLIWKGRKIVISKYLKDVPTGSYDFIVLKSPLGKFSINPLIKCNKMIGLRKFEKDNRSEQNGSLFYNLKTSGTFISNL